MKSIKNLSEFARQNNMSVQLAKQKKDNGYVFGVLNGKQVIYNPKSIVYVKSTVEKTIINGTEYEVIPVKSSSCCGCDLYDRSANRNLGKCSQPQVVCLGVNREGGQNVQFKRVKHGQSN